MSCYAVIKHLRNFEETILIFLILFSLKTSMSSMAVALMVAALSRVMGGS
jgi:hypothetical protein